jgi:hypothetical protein
MRTMIAILAFLWFSALIKSGNAEATKQERIDSLMAINKKLIKSLKKANSDIQMANEIIADPSLVVRLDGVAVQVFRADSSHK